MLLFDGLTKNYRYPGWRIGWTLGPKHMIDDLTRSGSALDGGPSRWEQRAAIQIVEPGRAQRETQAMRDAFKPKRDLTAARLKEMGVALPREPEGTFYAWGSVADLPRGLNDGIAFFREALKHQVMVVPGEFFDVNPAKRRHGRAFQLRRAHGGRIARSRPPDEDGEVESSRWDAKLRRPKWTRSSAKRPSASAG